MTETFRRAYEHKGASFVEVYQNCNVFNDGAFEAITSKDNRPSMLVPLEHGKARPFRPRRRKGCDHRGQGSAVIVDVSEVGEERLLVHDESRPDPSLAFALSRLGQRALFAHSDRRVQGRRATRLRVPRPGPVGSRGRPERPGDLAALLRSGTTWTVE